MAIVHTGIGCLGHFRHVGDFRRTEWITINRDTRYSIGELAVLNTEERVWRLAEGVDFLSLRKRFTREIFTQKVITAEEPRRTVRNGLRRIAALEAVAEYITRLRIVREFVGKGTPANGILLSWKTGIETSGRKTCPIREFEK